MRGAIACYVCFLLTVLKQTLNGRFFGFCFFLISFKRLPPYGGLVLIQESFGLCFFFFFSSNESHYGFIFMSERGQHSISSVKERWYYTRNNNTEIVLSYEGLRAIILFFKSIFTAKMCIFSFEF